MKEAPSEQQQFRQAVHTVLFAISQDHYLREMMVMKGGILMALRYHSPRFTSDIDFSTSRAPAEINLETFKKSLETALVLASGHVDYGLDCRIQSCHIQPSRPDATYPSIKLRIGTAYRGSPQHRHLMRGQSSKVLEIDVSLNETMISVENLQLEEGDPLRIYGLVDLIAEKFRALLQQQSRNRHRRQDIFDLNQLLRRNFSDDAKRSILSSLREKSESRDIIPTADSLSNPEVKSRAKKTYHTLADEIEGELPDFDKSFELVEEFYRSLPWE